MPLFAIVLNMIAGIMQHNALGARFTSVEARFTSLETNMNAPIRKRGARFETLTGKVIEIHNRLTRG